MGSDINEHLFILSQEHVYTEALYVSDEAGPLVCSGFTKTALFRYKHYVSERFLHSLYKHIEEHAFITS